jgi:hypothetical protein
MLNLFDFALSSLRSLLFLSALGVKSVDFDFDFIPPGGTHRFFGTMKTETGGVIL